MFDLVKMSDYLGGRLLITSDHHFGHENIIKFCNRPFSSAEEMDGVMVERWNKVVRPSDLVVHLGDFTLNGIDVAVKFLKQLNGHIAFLVNEHHHDKRWIKETGRINEVKTATGGEVLLLPSLVFAPIGPEVVTLCHYPLEEWDRSFHGAKHYHGHTHGKLRPLANRYDVSVEVTDYFPVVLEA